MAEHVAKFGETPSGAAAIEGTVAHEKLEGHLTTLPAYTKPPKSVQAKGAVAGKAKRRPLTAEDDEFDHLMQCVEWVEDQPGDLYSEMNMDFGAQFGFVGLRGTVDITLVEPKRLTIADLKYGRMPVEVFDPKDRRLNPQLMIYLTAAIAAFGRRESYRIVIMQPRFAHPDGTIRVRDVSHAEYVNFLFDLEEAIEANYGKGQNQVGPWCRKFCDALPSCKAAKRHALRILADTPVE